MLCYREAEERRQAIALEKQQAAEARERELAAQRAQREAERQALQRLQRSFAVRVEGSVTIDKPPKVESVLPFAQCTTCAVIAQELSVACFEPVLLRSECGSAHHLG